MPSPEVGDVTAGGTRRRCVLLVVLALIVTSYLLYHTAAVRGGYLTGQSACNLGGSFNCDKVAESPYAELFGISVAGLGFFYFALWLALLIRGPLTRRPQFGRSEVYQRYHSALFVLATSGLPAIAYFAAMSLLIGYVCIFCALIYLIVLVLALLTWRALSPGYGTVSHLGRGASELLEMFTPTTGGLFGALFLWGVVLLSGLVAVLGPGALERWYFEPQRLLLNDEEYLRPHFEAWQQAPKHDLRIDESDDHKTRDYALGADDAVLTMVEFSDYQCPFCRRTALHLKPLVKEFEGKLRIVQRAFPLSSTCNPAVPEVGHEYSCLASEMARCAGEQGDEAYWQMHDSLFALDALEWSVERLVVLPAELGLDTAQFDACLAEPHARQKIAADVELANALGVQGTPTFYVNGKHLPFSRLEELPGLLRMIYRQQSKTSGG
ncbi:MAG: thioredoxin domain-containing protein [Bdellovibrionales bacterium]|nr:thioredoxin domain-containing protein [Bdellovibrionales bacterium]